MPRKYRLINEATECPEGFTPVTCAPYTRVDMVHLESPAQDGRVEPIIMFGDADQNPVMWSYLTWPLVINALVVLIESDGGDKPLTFEDLMRKLREDD